MSSPFKMGCSWLVAMIAPFSLVMAEVKVGVPFPDLDSYGLEGALPKRAGRVVLVDFWASWCAPCKASFPAFTNLQQEFGERGLTIVAVSVDRQPGAYRDFVTKFSPSFVTVRDGARKMAAEVKVPAMPASYLIDRRGILRAQYAGFHAETTVQELRGEIIKLLEEKL
jgi:thiol-disulfide isomerase/thioredoxin